MKSSRIIAVLVCVLMMCSVVFADTGVITADTLVLQIGNPIMIVDGEDAEIDPGRDTVPLIENGRTLVPIRAIIEALGGSVGWDDEKQEVTLTYNQDVIKLVIDSDKAYLNGEESILDVAPTTINERTMLPIRYIAESFNFNVEWNDETSTVTISKAADTDEDEIPAESFDDESYDIFDDPDNILDDEGLTDEEITEIDPEEEEEMLSEEDDMFSEDEEEFIE